MGLVRIILAISVYLGHAWPLFPPKVHEMSGGVISVRLFYIISGYLIAMVLSEKYGSLKNFYFSRALRLLPTSDCSRNHFIVFLSFYPLA